MTSLKEYLLSFVPENDKTDEVDGLIELIAFVFENIDVTITQITKYFDPDISPVEFLNWLGSWVGVLLDDNWSEDKKRNFLKNAVLLFKYRGTKKGMKDWLEAIWEIPVNIEDYFNGVGWRIGVMSTVGVDTRLMGSSNYTDLYRFKVSILNTSPLTDLEKQKIRELVDKIKPLACKAYTVFQT